MLVPPPAVRDEEHVPGATHRDVASHVYYSRVLDVVDIREVDHGVPVVRVADGERVHALVRLVRGDEKHAAAADDLALRVEGPSFKANVGVELKGVRSGVERRRGVAGSKVIGARRDARARRERKSLLRIGVHRANAVA